MKYGFWYVVIERCNDVRQQAQIALHKGKVILGFIESSAEPRKAPRIRIAIKDDDVFTFFQKRHYQIGTNKTGSAGNKNRLFAWLRCHRVSPFVGLLGCSLSGRRFALAATIPCKIVKRFCFDRFEDYIFLSFDFDVGHVALRRAQTKYIFIAEVQGVKLQQIDCAAIILV